MRYLTLPALAAARNRSRLIATALGCGRDPADVTRFWFGVIEHPDQGRAGDKVAFKIPDDMVDLKDPGSRVDFLAALEKGALKTEAEMDADGWFDNEKVAGQRGAAK